MIEINIDSFINELLMLKKPAIIVEGLDDVTVYRNLFNITANKFTVTSPSLRYARNRGGKGEVIKIIDYTLKRCTFNQRKKIIGIIDADFDHICNIIKKRNNLFLTDKHDIETQIISSDAFKKFLNSFYRNDDPNKLLQNISNIRNYCLQKSMSFGIWILGLYKMVMEGTYIENQELYRKLSLYKTVKKELGNVKRFITIDNKNNDIYIETSKLQKEFIKIMNGLDILSDSELKKMKKIINKLKSEEIDPYQCVSGHDAIIMIAFMSVLKILGLDLKGLRNEQIKQLMSDEKEFFYFCKDIETKIRNSYELTHFKSSKMYKEITKFNESFQII